MPKGFFTQCSCLLCNGKTSIADLKAQLEAAGLHVAKETPAAEHWQFGGRALVVPYRPEVNGAVIIDVIEHPWPDQMGDPKLEPTTFGAWSTGQFGPSTFPGGLERAVQHAWSWPAGRSIAPTHRSVVRIRSSYVGGASGGTPIMPKDYDALAELAFINQVVRAVGEAPGVLCYFNPCGEVLRDLESFGSIVRECASAQQIPLPLWANVRLFKLDAEFSCMDTVGNEQFDALDVEVVYPSAKYDPGTIDYYMRNVTHYLMGLDRELRTGESIDGPGENQLSWVIDSRKKGLASPPRRVLRLSPAAEGHSIRATLDAAGLQ